MTLSKCAEMILLRHLQALFQPLHLHLHQYGEVFATQYVQMTLAQGYVAVFWLWESVEQCDLSFRWRNCIQLWDYDHGRCARIVQMLHDSMRFPHDQLVVGL